MTMLKTPSSKYKSFPPIRLVDRTWPDAVLTRPPIWCSDDLRAGNQALIEPMDIPRKLRMFDTLAKIGFKEIEVALPSASQVEFDFLRRLIDDNRIPMTSRSRCSRLITTSTPLAPVLTRRRWLTWRCASTARRCSVSAWIATSSRHRSRPSSRPCNKAGPGRVPRQLP